MLFYVGAFAGIKLPKTKSERSAPSTSSGLVDAWSVKEILKADCNREKL